MAQSNRPKAAEAKQRAAKTKAELIAALDALGPRDHEMLLRLVWAKIARKAGYRLIPVSGKAG